jgi:hypothetical protein
MKDFSLVASQAVTVKALPEHAITKINQQK